MTKPGWSRVLALSTWTLKKAHIVSPSQAIPDCIRYSIGFFCYNLKSQTNILASHQPGSKLRYSPCFTLLIHCTDLLRRSNVNTFYL